MKKLVSDILSKKNTVKILDNITNNLNMAEDSAVFLFPDILLDDPIYELVHSSKLKLRFLGKHFQRFKFIFLDTKTLENPDDTRLGALLASNLYPDMPSFESLQKLIKTGNELVLVVENPEKMKDPGTLFHSLHKLKKRLFNKITFIFIIESYSHNLLTYIKSGAPYSTVLINPVVLRFDDDHFHEGSEKKRKLGEQHHLSYLEGLFKQLSISEIKMLKKVAVKGSLSADEILLEKIYIQTGVIDQIHQDVSHFREVLKNIDAYNELHINHISAIDDIEELKILSKSDKKIIKAMSHSEGIFTKDELAGVMWGSSSLHKYSVWAMDQRMSRLRAKLIKAGYRPNIISTVKGKGYILNI